MVWYHTWQRLFCMVWYGTIPVTIQYRICLSSTRYGANLARLKQIFRLFLSKSAQAISRKRGLFAACGEASRWCRCSGPQRGGPLGYACTVKSINRISKHLNLCNGSPATTYYLEVWAFIVHPPPPSCCCESGETGVSGGRPYLVVGPSRPCPMKGTENMVDPET